VTKHSRRRTILTLVALLALPLLGCTSGGTSSRTDELVLTSPQPTLTSDNDSVDRAELKVGGTLTTAIDEISPQLNVLHRDSQVSTQTLWSWYNPQVILSTATGESYPNPAYISDRQVSTVDGNTVLTMTFVDAARFNDGTPMDWRTIESTWIANRGDNGYDHRGSTGYDSIASVARGESDKQAVVTFSGSFAWTDALFFNVIHPAVDSADKFNTAYLDDSHAEWGAGPYKIETWDAGSGTVTFAPNENWWGDPPLLDERTFVVMNSVAALNAFKAGDLDLVATGTADRLEQVEAMQGTTSYRAANVSNTMLFVNAARPQFSDLATRQALFMAIDRERVKDEVFEGLDYYESPVGSAVLYPFQQGYDDSLAAAGYTFNVAEANNLLDEAGWTTEADGTRVRDGVRFEGEMPIFDDDPAVESRAYVIRQQLRAIGFDLKVTTHPSTEFSSVLREKNWDLMTLTFSSSDAYGAMWMCQVYCVDGALNFSGAMPEAFQSLIQERVDGEPSKEAQVKAAMDLEPQLMRESWGFLPLYNGPVIKTAKAGLANLDPEPYKGLDMFGIQPVEDVGWME